MERNLLQAFVQHCRAGISSQQQLLLLAHLLQLSDFICTLAVLPLKSVCLILVHCTSVNSVE
jgi:hypothetical protein